MRVNVTEIDVSDEVKGVLLDQEYTFVLFVPHTPNPKSTVLVCSPVTKCGIADIQLERDAVNQPYLGVWWYHRERNKEDVESVALQGCGFLDLSRDTHLTPQTVHLYCHSLKDSTKVATLTISYQLYGYDTNLLERGLVDLEVASCVDKHKQEVRKWIQSIGQHFITEEGSTPWQDCIFTAPRPLNGKEERFPTLPMWMFTAQHLYEDEDQKVSQLESLLDRRQRGGFTAAQVDQLMKVAMIRLCIDPSKPVPDNKRVELFCEMATFLVLCMRYRVDRCGNRFVDQWSSLCCHPCPELAGYDCEDGCEFILRVVRLLRNHALKSQNELFVSLVESVKDYEFCLCVGTMKMDLGVIWHAWVMGFERDWLLNRLSGKRSLWGNGMKRPPLFLESTDYIASDSSFSSKVCNRRYFKNAPLTLEDDPFCLLKIDPFSLQIGAQYRRVCMAFTPQFLESHGVPMVFFTDSSGSELGALVYRPVSRKQKTRDDSAVGGQIYDSELIKARIAVPHVIPKDERPLFLKEVKELASWHPHNTIPYNINIDSSKLTSPSESVYCYYSIRGHIKNKQRPVLAAPLRLTSKWTAYQLTVTSQGPDLPELESNDK